MTKFKAASCSGTALNKWEIEIDKTPEIRVHMCEGRFSTPEQTPFTCLAYNHNE